jgi:hypothetical protein
LRYHFPVKSNRATRPGRIPSGTRASNSLYFIYEKTASPAGHGSRTPGRALLIETLPRIEISITRSFKRRKHFLIATRMHISSGRLCALRRGFPGSTKRLIPTPEFAKINRDIELIEHLVSHSKQRPDPQINRDIFYPEIAAERRSNGPVSLALRELFTNHKSRITSHASHLTNHFLLRCPFPQYPYVVAMLSLKNALIMRRSA